MRKSKFSEAQIVEILRKAEAPGQTIEGVARQHGVNAQTFYRWKKTFGGATEAQVVRLRQMEAENIRLRKLVVERDLELDVMKEIAAKKW